MRTPICEILGIDHPVLQAPIGGAAGPALAAAVSNAGGLGCVALTGSGGDEARRRIRRTRELTNRSFAVNVVLAYDADAEIEAIVEEEPTLTSFVWGDPSPYVDRVHAAGSKVMMTVGSVEEAKKAVGAGVDIIVAQGWEAGGHVRGIVSTLALIPAVVDEVGPVPVVAAGGIADGRGLAAVLALGAEAAWVGTRFLASTEANVHPDYRARVLAATASDTVYSELFDGGWPDAPGRVVRTPLVDEWERCGRPARGARGAVKAMSSVGLPVASLSADTMRQPPERTMTATSACIRFGLDRGSVW